MSLRWSVFRNAFAVWVLTGTLVLLFFLFSVTAFVLLQSRTASNDRLNNDSVVNLAFQMEREFLRLRYALQLVSTGSEATASDDWSALVQRYEIFVSRVVLLREGPSIAFLQEIPEYRELMPKLDDVLAWLEPRMKHSLMPHDFASSALQALDRYSYAVQDFSFSVNRRVLLQTEEQREAALRLERWIIGFSVALGLTLTIGAWALWVWQRKQVLAQERLHQLNEALSQARDDAVAGSQAKTRFVANMSHELRTPFNGMLGALQLLDVQLMPEPQRDLLLTARSSAEHLLRLLNDVLDLSALDAGKLTLHLAPVNMKDLLDSVGAMFRPWAQNKGLALEVSLEIPLAVTDVLVDATRVRQVLINLLNNAIKFTDHGRVSLDVRVEALGPLLWRWHVQVRDSGPGVAPEMVARLFKRFEQADESTTRRHEGVGLGLEISRHLARRMGGDLVFVAQAQGACFELTLTAQSAPAALAPTPAEGGAALEMASTGGLPALKVLVAEDHPVNARLLTQQLAKLGHESVWAENGQIALDQLAQQHFDLILMDIHMPVMDGLQATMLIRSMSSPRLARLPIVAVTADVLGNARERYLEVGMNAVLEKPYKSEVLAECLKMCWSSANAAAV